VDRGQGSKAVGKKKEYLCNTETHLFIKTREGRRLLTSGVGFADSAVWDAGWRAK